MSVVFVSYKNSYRRAAHTARPRRWFYSRSLFHGRCLNNAVISPHVTAWRRRS